MKNVTGILGRVDGVERPVRLAPSYLLSFLLLLIPHSALAQSNAEWTQYKIKCGIPASTAYNDWVAQGSHCYTSTGGAANAPSAPTLTPQQQLAVQVGAQAGNMIGTALHDWLFGAPPAPPAPPDPAELQRQSSAQQLNNSGIYLFKQKNYAGAIDEFQKALTYTPGDQNIQRNLALAKKQLKNVGIAGQTSDAIGQLLGTAPADKGIFGFDQLTYSSAPNPNGSALNFVNLDSDPNTVGPHSMPTEPSAQSMDTQATVQALDNVLGNGLDPELKRQLDDFANNELPRRQESTSMQSASNAQPEIQSQKTDAEQTTKAIDQAIGQNQSTDAKQPPVGANAATQQPNSHILENIGNPDFDGSTKGNARLGSLHPNPVQSRADLRGTGTITVNSAPVKPSSISSAGSGGAMRVVLPVPPPSLSGFSAPGTPIFDCVSDAATINRLADGLPGQQEVIRRTQAALDSAREDARDDSAEAREKWIEGTIKMLASTANFIAGSSEKFMAREGALRSAGISPKEEARFKFLEKVKQIHELSEKLEGAGKVYDAAVAGKAFGDTVLIQKTARDLTDLIAEAGVLLVDSGIAEEAGGKFALALWGPIGELGFSGVSTGLDLLAASMQAGFSAAEADQAARNLEVLRSQYGGIQDRIYNLQQELAQGCSKKAN